MPSDSPFRVLFVCWGNICRSPAAENIFRKVLAASPHAARIECDSAGTIDAHTGKPPDRRMQLALARRGIPVQGTARCIARDDFARFDLILTMDDFNREEVLALTRSAAERSCVRPFTDFCRNGGPREVPDPYYGGDDGFETVANLIEDGCAGVLAHIASQLD